MMRYFGNGKIGFEMHPFFIKTKKNPQLFRSFPKNILSLQPILYIFLKNVDEAD